MTRLTDLVLRHRRLTVLAWLVVAALGALTAATTTSRMTSSFAMPGAAAATNARIEAEHGSGGQDPLVPVLTAPPATSFTGTGTGTGTATAAADAAATAARVFAAARAVDPHVRVLDRASTGDDTFLTADGRSTFALVFTPAPTRFGADPLAPGLTRAMTAALPAGWTLHLTGESPLAESASRADGPGVLLEALIGAGGALVVLVLVFASLLALVPLLVAAVSVLTTFLLVLGLTYLTDVSQIVQFLIALIGLGVAIDYSLLIVTRWREERAAGLDGEAAVRAAMQHAGRAVAFSGVTVAIGLLALVVLPVPMLRSVGYGGVAVPLVSVLVSLTLLPVVLASAGPRLDWPRLRTERDASRAWSAWARLVYRRRWSAAVLGTALLALLALPALHLQLGAPAAGALSTSGPAVDGLATLTGGGVPAGTLTPIEVLVTGDAAAAVQGRLRALGGVHAAVTAQRAAAPGTTAVVSVLPSASTDQQAGQDTVALVRRTVAHDPSVLGVGGSGAATLDSIDSIYGTFPLMLTLIALATFALLARAFRSVLLAAKAVVFNLASLGAAYGVLVWVWQDGHGTQALWGLPASGAVTLWVPLMVFAFLFGLSMDYEVFILARVREVYDRTGSAREAVVEGIGRTGRLVSSAALILMLTFLSMSTGPVTDVKILATGLGAGILVDAVVVRCLLVPALVALLGRWNWWLPGGMARVLRVEPSAAGRTVAAPPSTATATPVG